MSSFLLPKHAAMNSASAVAVDVDDCRLKTEFNGNIVFGPLRATWMPEDDLEVNAHPPRSASVHKHGPILPGLSPTYPMSLYFAV